jgi:hypothetical protein
MDLARVPLRCVAETLQVKPPVAIADEARAAVVTPLDNVHWDSRQR